MSDAIDIRWIPEAKAAWEALRGQEVLVVGQIRRLEEKRDRYAHGSIARAMAEMEIAVWLQVADVVQGNLAGKTVQPS